MKQCCAPLIAQDQFALYLQAIITDMHGQNRYLDARTCAGLTPLHMAAWAGHVEVAKILLDNGAFLNPKIVFSSPSTSSVLPGSTPTHLATRKNRVLVVKALLTAYVCSVLHILAHAGVVYWVPVIASTYESACAKSMCFSCCSSLVLMQTGPICSLAVLIELDVCMQLERKKAAEMVGRVAEEDPRILPDDRGNYAIMHAIARGNNSLAALLDACGSSH